MHLHQIFNLGIAIAYFSIPLSLGSSVLRSWHHIPVLLRLTIAAFALFIAGCGTGHGLMAFLGHGTLITASHGVTFLISAPVAIAFPVIAERLRQILLHNRKLTEDLQHKTQALQHSETMFHSFLDSPPKLLAWIKNEQLVNTYGNQALQAMFGFDPVGKRDEEWLPEEAAIATTANDRQILETGQPSEFTEVVPTPDGINHSWHSYKFLLVVNGARFVAGTATEITELEQLRRDVELAFRELEEFTYATSHDLKTPLRGIKGLLALLERKLDNKLSDYDRSLLRQVRIDCDYANDLLAGILAYSKVGQAQTRRVSTNISTVLAQVCTRFTERFLELGASIDYPAELPMLSVDRTQLQQVLENLIDNALKY